MALEVIGSGLGRTGTKSMQTALTMLGFGPCHHMIEVFAHPESMALWIEAGAGRPDWEAIFKDYKAMVDYPGAAYWRELAAFWPEAKVIHTQRDPDAWFDSTQATIFAPHSVAIAQGPLGAFFESFGRRISPDFRSLVHDRAFMTDYFRRNTEAVEATIPPDRLLVYEAGEGWERLCDFLEAAVPDAPFPSENSRAEFAARAAAVRTDAAASAGDD